MYDKDKVIDVKTGIVLVAHGSRKRSANQELLRIAELLAVDFEDSIVQPAYLELAEPDIPTGIGMCIEQGAGRVIVVPYFLLPGSHVREDIPQFVAEASARHPEVPIRLVRAMGYHPVLADIILDQVDALLSTARKREGI